MFRWSRTLFRTLSHRQIPSTARRHTLHTQAVTSALVNEDVEARTSAEDSSARAALARRKEKSDNSHCDPMRPPSTRICIDGLPETTTFKDLKEVLIAHDKLIFARMTSMPGRALAQYKDVETAKEALHALKDKTLLGRQIRADYFSNPQISRTHRRVLNMNAGEPIFYHQHTP